MSAEIIYNAKCSPSVGMQRPPKPCGGRAGGAGLLPRAYDSSGANRLIYSAASPPGNTGGVGCPQARGLGSEYGIYPTVKVVRGMTSLSPLSRSTYRTLRMHRHKNYTSAQRFLNEVDAAAVYVNASTRFTTD